MLEAIITLYLMPSWRAAALLGLTIVQSLLLLFLPEWGIFRQIIAVSALVYIVWNFHVLSADLARKRRFEARPAAARHTEELMIAQPGQMIWAPPRTVGGILYRTLFHHIAGMIETRPQEVAAELRTYRDRAQALLEEIAPPADDPLATSAAALDVTVVQEASV